MMKMGYTCLDPLQTSTNAGLSCKRSPCRQDGGLMITGQYDEPVSLIKHYDWCQVWVYWIGTFPCYSTALPCTVPHGPR